MKLFVLSLGLLVSVSAHAVSWRALNCKSLVEVEGWVGSPTFEYVYVTAQVNVEDELFAAEINGAFESDSRNLTSQEDPAGTYRRYKYGPLEDAWRWFNLFIPKNFREKSGSFKGALQIYSEESPRPQYVDLSCTLK